MPITGRDQASLWDILQAAEGIHTTVSAKTIGQYSADSNLRLATERRLEIIGEAARRVSETFQKEHPELPWRAMIGLRNVLAHEYDEIDNERVWRVAVDEIPTLLSHLKRLVPSSPPESNSPPTPT